MAKKPTYNDLIGYGLSIGKSQQEIMDELKKQGMLTATSATSLNTMAEQGVWGDPEKKQVMNKNDIYSYDQSDLDQDQRGLYNFGTRMLESGDAITQMQGDISKKGLIGAGKMASEEAMAGTAIGSVLISDEIAEWKQIEKNFITAVMREESGAQINEDEFKKAQLTYIPQPGDSKKELAYKKQAREMTTQNFLGGAGIPVDNLFTEKSNESVDNKINMLHEFATNNPDDPRSIAFMKDYDDKTIDMETGMPLKKENLTPAEQYRQDTQVLEQAGAIPPKDLTEVQQLGADAKQLGSDVLEAGKTFAGGAGEAITPNPIKASTRSAGAVAKLANDLVGAGVKFAIPNEAEDFMGALVEKGLDNEVARTVTESWKQFEKDQPEMAQTIKDQKEGAMFLATLKGTGALGKLDDMSASAKVVDKVDDVKVTKAVAKGTADLKEISRGTKAMMNQSEKARSAGVANVEQEAVKTGLLKGVVDADGKITTKGAGGALEKYRADHIGQLDDAVATGLATEGKSVSVEALKKAVKKSIESKTTLRGTAGKKALSRAYGEIDDLATQLGDDVTDLPLSEVNNLKSSIYKGINYDNPKVAMGDKTAVRGIKEFIESSSDDVSVKAINSELTKRYAIADYIEKLDGAIVKGGRLGKYMSSVTGAGIGTMVGGSIGGGAGAMAGGVLGGSLGSHIRGLMMKSKLK